MKGNKWRIEKEEERGGEERSGVRKAKVKDKSARKIFSTNKNISQIKLLIFLSSYSSYLSFIPHPSIFFSSLVSSSYSIYLILLFNLSHPLIQFISSYYSIYLILLFNLSHPLIQFVSSSYSIYLILLFNLSHPLIQFISSSYSIYLNFGLYLNFTLSSFLSSRSLFLIFFPHSSLSSHLMQLVSLENL